MNFLSNFYRSQSIVYLGLTFSMICWAFSFVWYKLVFEHIQPLTLVLFRLALSSLFLFLFASLIGKLQAVRKKDFGIFLLLAFFEPLLNFLGEAYGVQRVSPTLAAVIISTIPLFAPIAAYLFAGEKMTWMNLLGILISFSGVGLVVHNPEFSWSGSGIGIALLFLAVLAALGYSVIISRLSERYNSITLISFQNLIGIVYFFPLFYIFESQFFPTIVFSPDLLRPLMYLAIFASSLAFITFVYGVQKLGITRSNIFVNLIPVFTAIFAWIILDNKLSLLNFFGILVVISGLFLSQWKRGFQLLRKKRSLPI
jgi:drug/metabolite transporter (DMT)-like permease